MEQIISANSGSLMNDSSLLKNNVKSNNAFLKLLDKDSLKINDQQNPTGIEKPKHVGSHVGSAVGSIDQKSDLERSVAAQLTHLDTHESRVKNSINVSQSQSEQQKTSELYEQKWFSIGKLSYVDTDKQLKFGIDQTISSANSAETNPVIQNRELDINAPQKPPLSIHNSLLGAQLQYDRSIENSDALELSKLASQVKNTYDIEKKKLSFIKESDSTMLVVRDYHSNKNDVLGYVKQLLQFTKNTISKVTLNGKAVK